MGQVSAPVPLSVLTLHFSTMQSSKRRQSTPIPIPTIDLTEEDSRDSSRSSSTLSGSSSQEGQNSSTELGTEETESRDMGMALEYQVRMGPTLLPHLGCCSFSCIPSPTCPSLCAQAVMTLGCSYPSGTALGLQEGAVQGWALPVLLVGLAKPPRAPEARAWHTPGWQRAVPCRDMQLHVQETFLG